MKNQFNHLHCHTEFSLLDGAIKIDKLIAKAQKYNMNAVALTDHGAMYGAIQFYEKATKAGIKPIIGCELYQAPASRLDKVKSNEKNHHLVVLAKSTKGYQNIIKLSSVGFMEGFYYKPRVDLETLSKYSQDVIALSACMAGKIPKLLLIDEYEKAKDVANSYRDIFGKENFYLELQDQKLEGQNKINEGIIDISKELNIPLVATNDVHYLDKENSFFHDILLCIQTGKVIDEAKRLRFNSDEFYFKSPEEMNAIFSEHPDALKNTLEIADQCNVEIDLGNIYLPEVEIPKDFTADSYLSDLCQKNLKSKYPVVTEEINQRIEYELNMVSKMGFSGYFIIVADFVDFAKKNGIWVGSGRGSAAGSIIAYLLNITEIDPIKYGLIFERFLNPERREMPDIDIDFEHKRRGEIFEYIVSKYGSDHVAQLITFQTIKAKQAIKDAGRVLGYPYALPDRMVKLITDDSDPIDASLKKNKDLSDIYKTDNDAKRIIDAAKGIEGLVRQDSIHAAGVVIAPDKLTNYLPVQKEENQEIVTQYEKNDIGRIGLLKMDILGIRTLDVVKSAIELIKVSSKVEIDINNIDFEDAKTFELLQNAQTIGVFQLSSSGMRNLLRDLKPTKFTEIIALVALYRPGPLGSGMHQEFVARKHGRQKITYIHPIIEPILKETYGVIVYQEQVMEIAVKMAAYTLAEADTLRKAMGKKEVKIMKEQKKKFIEGCKGNKIASSISENTFSLIEHFGQYGFNKSHSAAYAVLAYQTAYLKANYPLEYMASLLTIESQAGTAKEKLPMYIQDCRKMGINVLTPDINTSLMDFTVDGYSIRFGLSAIKNIGESLVENALKAKKDSRFYDLFDFLSRIDTKYINKRAVESLIKAGAFDCFGYSRNALIKSYPKFMEIALKNNKDMKSGQINLFSDNQKNMLSDEQVENINEMQKEELLAYEKEMLGLYISDHPLLDKENELKAARSVSLIELKEKKDGEIVKIAGLISKTTWKNISSGKMGYVEIEDLESSVEVIVFPKLAEDKIDIIKDDAVVVIKGRVDKKSDSHKETDVKVIAQAIYPIGEVEDEKEINNTKVKKTKKYRLNILLHRNDSKDLFSNDLKKIKDILKKFKGNDEVFVEIPINGKNAKLKLGREYNTNVNNTLLDELNERFKAEALKI